MNRPGKRRKEIAREDKRKKKEAARVERRKVNDEAKREIPAGEDPDIAGIVPGPQPLPDV
jgi:hypothetical protein